MIDALVREKIRSAAAKRMATPAVIDDIIQTQGPLFRVTSEGKIRGPSGESVGDALEKLIPEKPHWNLTPADAMKRAAKAAFGKGATLQGRADYLKLVGEQRYQRDMQEWGASPAKLTPAKSNAPGKNPWKAEREKFADISSNPFKKFLRADGTPDPAIVDQVARLIKALGTKKVEAIAKAAGRTITGALLRA